jgi:hypothetical protein
VREAPRRTRGFPWKTTLREFGKCAVALCEVLHQDSSLNATELLFIDNPLQIVQMAYLRWKRKFKASSSE